MEQGVGPGKELWSWKAWRKSSEAQGPTTNTVKEGWIMIDSDFEAFAVVSRFFKLVLEYF